MNTMGHCPSNASMKTVVDMVNSLGNWDDRRKQTGAGKELLEKTPENLQLLKRFVMGLKNKGASLSVLGPLGQGELVKGGAD